MAAISVYGITPFDATQDYTVTFTHPLRSYGNFVRIVVANTFTEAYNNTIRYNMPGPQTHTIPANSLTNGTRYILQMGTLLEDGTWDNIETPIHFYCFKQPTLEFNNIPDSNMIYKSSFTANVTYKSEDYEPLQSYTFLLYDSKKQLISSSNSLYNTNAITFTYNSLQSGLVYFLRCRGVTIHNMSVDSGYIQVEVDYTKQNYYSLFYAENDRLNGYVTYKTNLKVIIHSGNDDFVYENGWIDLNDKELHYEDNFAINGDFSITLKGKDLWKDTNHILTLSSFEGGTIYLSSYIYNESDTPYLRFRLTATHNTSQAVIDTKSIPRTSWIDSLEGIGYSNNYISPNFKPTPLDYIIYSLPLQFTKDDEITIFIMRIKDIYSLEVAVNDVVPVRDNANLHEEFGGNT